MNNMYRERWLAEKLKVCQFKESIDFYRHQSKRQNYSVYK